MYKYNLLVIEKKVKLWFFNIDQKIYSAILPIDSIAIMETKVIALPSIVVF